ncbi:hypothetical protein [Rhizobium sp. SL86]|uniref:hypothetical protein n=1 Tax=Rhizobium sp. SL86 TaxID=2995148 RepID=UPI002275AFFD|nr:hypothetical protein [Rhizobium sp. SL86]MCY1664662.1 hypothetical protein [Rhizobium sp. SL86]
MQEMITAMVAARLLTRAMSEDEFYRRHADPMPRPLGRALCWAADMLRAVHARSSGLAKTCRSRQDDHGKARQSTT